MQSKHVQRCLFLVAAILSCGVSNAEWKHNTELFFAASDDASASGLRWLKPWKQDGKAMWFSDFRYIQTDKNTEEFNLGGGYRKFNKDDTAILGLYGFFDYRFSASNRKYPQITLGTEYLLDKWEFRSNYYLPLKDEYIVDKEPDRSTLLNESYIGNFINRVVSTTPGGDIVEEALQGYDLELGYLLPGAEDFEIRAHLALYGYSAPVIGDANGLRARIEAFPRQNFRVSFSIENDDVFETRSFLEFTLPLGRRIGRPGKRSLHQRMTQFAYRDLDVRETSRIDSSRRVKASNQAATVTTTRPEEGIAHIDSSRSFSDTEADGSIERPYNSVEQCTNGASNGKTFHCGGGNTATKTIFLHANPSSTRNGVTQHYIGNLTLTDEQKLVGDGATTGNFKDLATGQSPILIGAAINGDNTPVITMRDRTQVQGLQLGWGFADANASTTNPETLLPTGSIIPSTGLLVQDAPGAIIRDVTLTGFQPQSLSQSFSADTNFETGIHVLSTGAETETAASLSRVTANLVLGDAVYNQVNLTTNTNVEQRVSIIDSDISRNGRGVHSSVESTVADSFAKQTLVFLSDNPSSTSIANRISLNFNEGILMENINTLQSSAVTFTAEQDLRVQNTQIESNQGAGIQTFFGPSGSDDNGTQRTSNVHLERTTITRNDGSGLVLQSTSANVDATLENTLFTANLEVNRSQGNRFGQRLDLSSIDCGNSAASGSDPACGSPDTNGSDNRTANGFRFTDYGIYLKNRDSSGAPGTQNISILENFTSTLHAADAAQIFLDSSNMQDSRSLQTISLRPATEEPANTDNNDDTVLVRGLDTRAGVSTIVNGSVVTGQQAGATSPAIAFCDNTAGTPSTDNDRNSPHIAPFGGDLSTLARIEICP